MLLLHEQPYKAEGMRVKPTYQELEQRVRELERADEEHEHFKKTLRESEEMYHILFSLANDVLYSIDTHLRVMSVSPSIERVLGYRPEELVGKHILDLKLLEKDSLDKAASDTLKILSGVKIAPSLYEFLTKDGIRKFGEVRGVPLVRNKIAVAVIAVARDITERVEMEKSLRESEERFRTIFESAHDGIFMKNPALEYVFVNPCMEKLFGLRSTEILALGDQDLFGEDPGSRIRESDLRVIGGEVVEEEYSRRMNGAVKTFHVIKVPMRDTYGAVTGLCGIARDITERKRSEEELVAKERELAHQARYLEEMNIALKVLLDAREKEKKQAQETILSKARKIIYPYLEKMEAGRLDDKNKVYLCIIRSNIGELLSPGMKAPSSHYPNFTPTEMRIADFIRQGKTTKEIAAMLNTSLFAVSFHRSNIRKKCGLLNTRKNLRTHLDGSGPGNQKNQ